MSAGSFPEQRLVIEPKEDIDLEKLKSISKELHLEILKQISEDFHAEISKSIYEMERSLEILDDVEVKERLLSNANPIPVGGKSGTTLLSQIHIHTSSLHLYFSFRTAAHPHFPLRLISIKSVLYICSMSCIQSSFRLESFNEEVTLGFYRSFFVCFSTIQVFENAVDL